MGWKRKQEYKATQGQKGVKELMNFETFISTNEIFLNIHYFPSQYFFDLKEIIFENFNISENNIISVELGKVLVSCLDIGLLRGILYASWSEGTVAHPSPPFAISPCYEMSNFEGEVGRVQGGAIMP